MIEGVALILIASEKAVKKYNLKTEAIWTAGESVGVHPSLSSLGYAFAIEKLLKSHNLNLNNVDLIEINEDL